MSSHRVGYIVGSVASTSLNRTLAGALVRLAPDELELVEIPIKDLPLYDHGVDANFPPHGQALKDAIAGVDAVLIVTPEYNRSIPGALKNALDWASRPWGTNSFAGKPCAVIGASPGAIGTAVGQQHLRGVLNYLDAPLLNSPEGYVQLAPGTIEDDGSISDESLQEFLSTYMVAVRDFVARMQPVLAARR